MALGLAVQAAYPNDGAIIHWRGTVFTDPAEFDLFLQGQVRARVTDQHFEAQLAQDLQALATTEMATATLQSLLNSTVAPLDWEIGEAIAECLLEDEFGVNWAWNENRDRKRHGRLFRGLIWSASSMMGMARCSFLERSRLHPMPTPPPGVLAGRSGLIHQIGTLATSCENSPSATALAGRSMQRHGPLEQV